MKTREEALILINKKREELIKRPIGEWPGWFHDKDIADLMLEFAGKQQPEMPSDEDIEKWASNLSFGIGKYGRLFKFHWIQGAKAMRGKLIIINDTKKQNTE